MITLRPYQEDLIKRTRSALISNRRVIMCLPAGGGKTACSGFMALSAASKGKRVLFLTHRNEILRQTENTFKKIGLDYGIIAAGKKEQPHFPVQVASIDTLKNRLDTYTPPDLVIIDECHHTGAKGWAKVQESMPEAFFVGLTATPCRLDGKSLRSNFDEIIEGPTVTELMGMGALSPYRIFGIPSPDLSAVKTKMGDYDKSQAAEIMDKPAIVSNIVANWKRICEGKKTMIFAITVEHSKHIIECFIRAGISAEHIDGKTHHTIRADVLRRYALGEITVISNVGIAGEGFDLANLAGMDVSVDAVILARPTKSLSLHIQQMGRAMRPNQTDPAKVAFVLDCAGNAQRLGLPDDEREWTLADKPKKKKKDVPEIKPPWTCTQCFFMGQPPKPSNCPACGGELKKTQAELDQIEADMIELKRAEKIDAMDKDPSLAKTYGELCDIGKMRGYKKYKGWALYRSKEMNIPLPHWAKSL